MYHKMSDILNVTKDAEDNAGDDADDFQAMTIPRSLLGEKKTAEPEMEFNSLPDDKILDWSKLKQIADDISKCI